MKRTETKRVVEFDTDESYDGSHARPLAIEGVSHAVLARDMPPGAYKDNSLTLTLTPTTQYLDQPVLLDMAKDDKSTGSSTTLPGIDGRSRGSGTLRGQYGRLVNDELLKVDHKAPPVIRTAIAGMVGLVLGWILSRVSMSPDTQWWIGIVGYMYVSVLECLALPLIFTSVTLCIAQLMQSTKCKEIMVRLAVKFLVTAFLASAIGLLTGYAMAGTFPRQSAPPVELPKASIGIECPNEMMLTSTDKCDGKFVKDAAMFTITNITGIKLKDNLVDNLIRQDVSLATQIVDFFTSTFQENITEAFTTKSYLGIVVFAMFVGAGLVVTQDFQDMNSSDNYLFQVLKQVAVVLELILNGLIAWLPIGTLDGMTFTMMIGVVTNDMFFKAIIFPLVLLLALALNFLLVVCVGYFVIVRKNPFAFFWYLTPALIYMLASQRYAATTPIMMRCIEESKQVSRTLAHFTISLGMALSMCGTACYLALACVFMAYTSGLESQITAGKMLLLCLVSALSSFGTPQSMGAALTYVATVWLTVFQSKPPDSLAFVVAMEWITARMRNVYNITVVAFIARVIAEHMDETAEDEEDRAMHASSHEHEMMSPL